MTPQEATALMTYANQVDARVQLTEANADVWSYALKNVDYEKARWVIREHYASHVDGGPPRSLAPGMVRARVGELTRSAEGRRVAIEIAREKKALDAPVVIVDEPAADAAPVSKSRFHELMAEYESNLPDINA